MGFLIILSKAKDLLEGDKYNKIHNSDVIQIIISSKDLSLTPACHALQAMAGRSCSFEIILPI